MKINELTTGSAVVVKAIGVTELKDGDYVLVGIPCFYNGGKFTPIPPRWKLIPDIFDDVKGDELVIIKREK
jgi:hypothetical protein